MARHVEEEEAGASRKQEARGLVGGFAVCKAAGGVLASLSPDSI